jgi:hypothetical protein
VGAVHPVRSRPIQEERLGAGKRTLLVARTPSLSPTTFPCSSDPSLQRNRPIVRQCSSCAGMVPARVQKVVPVPVSSYRLRVGVVG